MGFSDRIRKAHEPLQTEFVFPYVIFILGRKLRLLEVMERKPLDHAEYVHWFP